MPSPGDSIDRYLIEAVLGEGGMGRVYRALDPRLGRRVALKVLRVDPEKSAEHTDAAARMVREARAAAAFNHPNVVAIYDVGQVDGAPFIAMELITGETLRARAAGATTAQKLEWLIAAARGLGAAHRAGLVHRDVKPDNVMITNDGLVKILDFGIARQVEGGLIDASAPTVTPELPTLTKEGTMIGTLQYMAPEQLQLEPLDGRTDQFAWGVTAFEVLAGALPWPATRSGAHLVAAVLASVARPLRDLVPELDSRIAAAVARALEKKKEARFRTMEELVAALEGKTVVPSQPRPDVAAPPAGVLVAPTRTSVEVGVRSAPPSTRRWVWPSVAATAVVAGLVVTSIAVVPRVRSVPPLASATPQIDASRAPRVGRPPASPAASAAYESGLQALEDGQAIRAINDMREVVKLDPTFGAAYLRLASFLSDEDIEPAREQYREALFRRASLGEVDMAVLDALEPMFREPPVLTEYAKRIAEVSARYPSDAWSALLIGQALAGQERWDEAMLAYSRALAADPKYMYALSGKAQVDLRRGDFPRALQAFEDCTRASPSNVDCAVGRMQILGSLGRCEEAKAEAKRGLAVDPKAVELYDGLVPAGVQTGESTETVAQYLAHYTEFILPDYRARADAIDAENLAELSGDFRVATQATVAWEKALADHNSPLLEAVLKRLSVAEEAGELGAHRAEILSLWNRSVAWVEPSERTLMHVAHREYQVGLITAGELEQRRQAWKAAKIEEGRRSGVAPTPYLLWKVMYLLDVRTPDEAKDALAKFAEVGPIPPADKNEPEDQLALGLMYAAADHLDQALPLLEYGTRACTLMADWLRQTQALIALGDARAHAGDTAGARAAYEKVLASWGQAKPRSKTADLARARLAAMGK
ncbi:MAG TPA: protein kinase [Polyangiaceae bacterium]|jgi:serine/threonine-protein kinase